MARMRQRDSRDRMRRDLQTDLSSDRGAWVAILVGTPIVALPFATLLANVLVPVFEPAAGPELALPGWLIYACFVVGRPLMFLGTVANARRVLVAQRIARVRRLDPEAFAAALVDHIETIKPRLRALMPELSHHEFEEYLAAGDVATLRDRLHRLDSTLWSSDIERLVKDASRRQRSR